MSKYTRGLLAVILAVVLVLPAAAFAMLPEANARSSTGMDGPTVSGKVVDPNTGDNWTYWAAGSDGSGKITTQNVGRIWTDKTVEVGEESDFLTTLSAISSTSNTTTTVPKPLDIVLVLDASGSMSDPMSSSDRTKRIDALKTAANSFIDKIAEENAKISDESKRHKVAIVKFSGNKTEQVGNGTYREGGHTYNYSQTMKTLTLCLGEDAESLKSTVSSISPAGATRADYGMDLAEGISGREDAKKVVLFFTDGSPTSYNSFESSVADSAINKANSLKKDGTVIYTIGIFSGANPSADPTASGTINENKFMHAVSSNYPAATSNISYWGEWTINFGARAENANYYKSAKNAQELEDIFKDISESITEVVGYPTEIHDGYGEHKSGYITFTDELGDFMQVDGFTEVEHNGKTFKGPEDPSTTGNVDTYTFTGEAANLVITVQRAAKDNPQQGDIVEVKIPASLIPLRKFNVDKTKGTLTVNDVEPIRVKYASSVKAIARENLFTPDEALKKYIEKNTTGEQGSESVAFYANKWSDKDLGDTVANFTPATTNRYYFFQKQTPIYTDPACTLPAKGKSASDLASDRHYYYQDEFEVADANGKLDHGTTVIEFSGEHAAQFAGGVVDDGSGNLSFSEGTARLAFIDELHTDKSDNLTETASDVLNPKWNDTSSKASATQVNSHLGNNGKISYKYDMTPATVDTKAKFGLTKVLEGREWAEEDAFEFELTSEGDAPMPESATVTVTNADLDKGKAAINFGKITYAEPGEYTYEVREKNAGRTIDGITYSKNVAEITVTVTPNAKGELSAAVKVTSGETEFVNTYATNSVESSVTDKIEVTKVLDGRDLKDGEFSFELREIKGEDSELIETVKNDANGNVAFSPIKYTEAGEHTYTLSEVKGNAGGVTYDEAVYTVVTTISDNGKGQLAATHRLKDAEDVKKIEFKNAYNLTPKDSSVTHKITAYKSLTGRDLKSDEFEFELVEGDKVVATGKNSYDGMIAMSSIRYTEPGEHTYTLREVHGGTKSNGITYDGTTYTIVTTVTDNGDGTLDVHHVLKGDKPAEFKNSYGLTPESSSVTDQIVATKSLDGRDLKDGEFSFELVEGNDVVATGTNAADGKIVMGKITYDKPGNHTYTLREKLPNEAGLGNGITYDKTNYTIKTSVIDNGDGTLKVTHTLEGAKPARFENKYNTAPNESSVTDQIKATKTLIGRDLKDNEFSFELADGDDIVAIGTNNAGGMIMMSPIEYTEAGEHTYTLREVKGDADNGITYSTAVYTIVTTVTDDGNGKLTVEHKLQGDEPAAFENAYSVTPNNSSVTDQITATKVLTGRDLKDGEFSFELVEDGEVVAAGKNGADGKIVMDKITYDKPGEHTYILREVKGTEGNGITYDDKTYTVVTTITDNGMGKLVAKHELKDAKTAEFKNSYKPNAGEFSVTDEITATKSLTGRELKDGEFSFQLVEGEGEDAKVVATGKNAADGTITMSAVKYDKAGTHTYTLREVNGGTTSKGITYSDAKYTIETTITDNGDGTLKAEHVLKDATAATFENSYSVTPLETELDFGLSKAIDGRDWTDADEFSFTITAPEGTPLPDPATVTVSNKNADDNGIAAIKFGKIRYTAAGTYKYEIRENAGNAAGMTYDGHVATAEVTVTENDEGKLIANATKKESGRFTNTYRTELNYTAAGGLKLSKTLSGRPMTEGQFTFTVTPADAASADALGLHEGANVYKSPATAEATVGLIDILAGHEVKFTQADAGKTFTYTVAEKNDGQSGYSYDDAERTVTIAIADDGAGTLTATTTVSGGSDRPLTTEYKTGASAVESAVVPFGNSYSASTDSPGTPAKVVATKKLTGRPMANGEFYFGIAYAGETEAIDGTCVTNFNGQVSFGWLHYDTEMLANLVSAGRAIRTDADGKLRWTISYTAFEYTNLLADQGITAAKPSFSFKVIVVDNGDGTLTATPDYGGTEPVFENVYGAEAVNATLAGTKKLQAAEGLTPADITGKFTFTVTADEAGAPMPERTTATNDAAGNVDFGKIHFTLDDLNRALGVTTDASGDAASDAEANADEAEVDADAVDADESNDESEPAAPTAPRSHTFTYTVTESGSAPGVTNDANAMRKVSYTVTDDGAGHLSVKRDGGDGADFTFTNTYSVTPTDSVVTDQVKTVKRLTGRDLAAGEFTFELLEDGVVVASGTNDANGNVTLSPIHYEAPGTHTYTLREACPNALGLYKGVTYDGTTYTVVTTVSDNGDGTLTATHKLDGTTESAGFTNKYHAMPTQVSIGAIKVLEGRELKKDEFSFKLAGEDVESTVTNDADGKISFDKFEYDEPGTYVYTISEVKGDEAGMTYDKSVFTATVNVVDDGEGNLKASVAYAKGDKSVEGIVFNNTYKKPETPVPTPDPGTPKTVTNIVKTVKGFLPTTGDQQAAALLMAFVIAMAGVGALVWGIRKR